LKFTSFDSEYLRRLQQGDSTVEEHFAAYFRELIHLKCHWRISSPELLEDIQQETLFRVLQAVRRDALQHPERLGAYVNSVCNNVKMELMRTSRKYEPVDGSETEQVDPGEGTESALITQQHRNEVQRTLAELPDKDRNILRAVFLEEKTSAEVSHQFGVDGDYLRVLIHRAKQRFKKVYVRRAGAGG
jgi:RNA polymerase sigma-70 factor (ECF subfamily)